jgi:hypothetical protein
MTGKADALISLVVLLCGVIGAALVCVLGEASPIRQPPQPVGLAVALTLLAVLAVASALVAAARTSWRALPAGAGSGGKGAWWPHAAVVALTLVGFALRVVDLNRFGLGNDESLFVFAAGHERLGNTLRDSLTHFHPPTNFVALHYLLKLSWEPWVTRVPSLLGGTLAIYGMFLFVRAMFGTVAGVLGAFFTTFSPNLILLSQVCRNYSPSLPFYLLSFYFLARFLKERGRGSLYGFALFEFLAVGWHYGLLPAFLGANLVLFGFLVYEREPAGLIVRAVAAQAPVGALYVGAMLFHLPLTQAGQQAKVLAYMADEYTLDPLNPFRQLFDLMKYLVADSQEIPSFLLATVFVIGLLAGLVALWRLGFRRQVSLCLAFIPFVYLFAFVLKMLPFGGTRHSYYAFPFLFAIPAALGALMLTGKAVFQAGAGEGGARTRPGAFEAFRRHPVPGLVVVVLCLVYLFAGVRLYSNVLPYYLRQWPYTKEPKVFYKANFYKPVELPVRREDLELLSESVLKHVAPGEAILTSYITLMILKANLERPLRPFFSIRSRRRNSYGTGGDSYMCRRPISGSWPIRCWSRSRRPRGGWDWRTGIKSGWRLRGGRRGANRSTGQRSVRIRRRFPIWTRCANRGSC